MTGKYIGKTSTQVMQLLYKNNGMRGLYRGFAPGAGKKFDKETFDGYLAPFCLFVTVFLLLIWLFISRPQFHRKRSINVCVFLVPGLYKVVPHLESLYKNLQPISR